MSCSVRANNKTKNIQVLGKDFIQGLDNTAIYLEKLYSINFINICFGFIHVY